MHVTSSLGLHTHKDEDIHTCACRPEHIPMNTCINIHINMDTHADIHTYTQTLLQWLSLNMMFSCLIVILHLYFDKNFQSNGKLHLRILFRKYYNFSTRTDFLYQKSQYLSKNY